MKTEPNNAHTPYNNSLSCKPFGFFLDFTNQIHCISCPCKFHRRSNLLRERKEKKRKGGRNMEGAKDRPLDTGKKSFQQLLLSLSLLLSCLYLSFPACIPSLGKGPTRPDLSFRPAQGTSFPPNSATHHRLLAMATRAVSTTQLHFVGR